MLLLRNLLACLLVLAIATGCPKPKMDDDKPKKEKGNKGKKKGKKKGARQGPGGANGGGQEGEGGGGPFGGDQGADGAGDEDHDHSLTPAPCNAELIQRTFTERNCNTPASVGGVRPPVGTPGGRDPLIPAPIHDEPTPGGAGRRPSAAPAPLPALPGTPALPQFTCFAPTDANPSFPPGSNLESTLPVWSFRDPGQNYNVSEQVGNGPRRTRPMNAIGASSMAHECTHVNHSAYECWFRSKFPRSPDHRAFYFPNGRVAFVPESGVSRQAAADRVPDFLRGISGDGGGRFQTYFLGTSGHDKVSYLFDEYLSYTNGAETALAERPQQRSDAVAGALEFTVYSLAGLMAVKAQKGAESPEFQKLKAVFLLNAERSMTAFRAGSGEGSPFANREQNIYLQQFLSNTDAKAREMRQFLRVEGGVDWTTRVFGISREEP